MKYRVIENILNKDLFINMLKTSDEVAFFKRNYVNYIYYALIIRRFERYIILKGVYFIL